MTVVFERPMSPPIESSVIEIAHAPKAAANSADDEIVRLVHADDRPHDLDRGDIGSARWPIGSETRAHRSIRRRPFATSSIRFADHARPGPTENRGMARAGVRQPPF